MDDKLDSKLCKKFPRIFRDRNKSAMETAMCWGLAVGDGWYHVINNGCTVIQNHIDWDRKKRAEALRHNRALRRVTLGDNNGLLHLLSKGTGKLSAWQQKEFDKLIAEPEFKKVPDACPQVVATQVKEKFGGLRFYYQGGDQYVTGVMSMMESMADITCDVCGSPGYKGSSTGWVNVKCVPCKLGFKMHLDMVELTNDGEVDDAS